MDCSADTNLTSLCLSSLLARIQAASLDGESQDTSEKILDIAQVSPDDVKPFFGSWYTNTPHLAREKMVGLPNRAARCGICQGHKIKVRLCLHTKRKLHRLLITAQCDLSRPDCSRCKRLGLSCKYPDLQRGQIFVNRNLNNPRVKAVDILSTASTGTKKNANNLGNAYSTSLMTAIKRSHDKQNNSVPHPISSEDVDRIQLLSTFVDLHLPKAQGPILRPDAQSPATWINCLGDLASNSNTFDTSLKALCLAQIGLWHHDLGLMKESRRLYGSALRGLRDAVSHQKLEFPKATLATIIILSTYEVSLSNSRASLTYPL